MAALFAVCAAGLVGGFAALPARADQPADGAKKAEGANKLESLMAERLATLQALLRLANESYKAGTASVEQVSEATRLLFEAELEQCQTNKDRIRVLEKFVTNAKENERRAEQLVKTGTAPPSATLRARADRLRLEIALERVKAAPK